MDNAMYRMPYTVGPDKPLCDMSDRELESEVYDARTSVMAAEENESVGWGYDPAPRKRLEAAEREQRIRLVEEQVDTWITAPEDQGQIVEVCYGHSQDGNVLYQKVFDYSDRTCKYYTTDWPDDLEFDPWNGAGDLRDLAWEELEGA